jgi:hypothetical protein
MSEASVDVYCLYESDSAQLSPLSLKPLEQWFPTCVLTERCWLPRCSATDTE